MAETRPSTNETTKDIERTERGTHPEDAHSRTDFCRHNTFPEDTTAPTRDTYSRGPRVVVEDVSYVNLTAGELNTFRRRNRERVFYDNL